ncbi:MAG: HigA family addiction module antitoxin [Candidatus Baltobacteraceae bacterium]
MKQRVTPTHPGEVLLEDFLKPLDISAHALALALRVPVSRISEITKARRSLTAETALRLSRYFGTTPEFWIRLQGKYDLAIAADAKAEDIQRDVRPRAAVHA